MARVLGTSEDKWGHLEGQRLQGWEAQILLVESQGWGVHRPEGVQGDLGAWQLKCPLSQVVQVSLSGGGDGD